MTSARISNPCLLALLGIALGASSACAAINAVTAGIGGFDNGTIAGGDGTGTALITLNTVELALVKKARAPDGTVLADGADVFPGDEIYFVIYVDNPADHAARDVRLSDPLDEASFAYLLGTLEHATVPSGSDDAAIWAGTWAPLTDALGVPDDAASAADTGGDPLPDRITVGAESGQANQQVDLASGTLRAFRFRVRVR